MRPGRSFRIGGWIVAGLVCANAANPPAVVGWYNGDWQSGLPGQPNFFYKDGQYSRVYDDFVVPAGGWTVVGVFSDNQMDFDGVTKASWEIRRDMAPGKGGKKVASGLSRGTQVSIRGQGPFPGSPAAGYRIQVDGLHIRLAPGRYWLSVAPVGRGGFVRGGEWYANATLGKNKVDNRLSDNERALVSKTTFGVQFVDVIALSLPGQYGRAREFSQGVLIEARDSH